MVYLESVKLGDEDRLIVTSLTNRLMPFIRYDIGDSGRLQGRRLCLRIAISVDGNRLVRHNDFVRTRGGKSVQPRRISTGCSMG